MKVGEALTKRAQIQKDIADLSRRIQGNLVIQEGQEPAESVSELLDKLAAHYNELEKLLISINHTNSSTRFEFGGRELTVTEALAIRDVNRLRINALVSFRSELSGGRNLRRYGASELKDVPQIRVSDIQPNIDNISKDLRELDAAIQFKNWETDLVEQ